MPVAGRGGGAVSRSATCSAGAGAGAPGSPSSAVISTRPCPAARSIWRISTSSAEATTAVSRACRSPAVSGGGGGAAPGSATSRARYCAPTKAVVTRHAQPSVTRIAVPPASGVAATARMRAVGIRAKTAPVSKASVRPGKRIVTSPVPFSSDHSVVGSIVMTMREKPSCSPPRITPPSAASPGRGEAATQRAPASTRQGGRRRIMPRCSAWTRAAPPRARCRRAAGWPACSAARPRRRRSGRGCAAPRPSPRGSGCRNAGPRR